MDFITFIECFGNGYRCILDNNCKKWTKPVFCRQLLCNIADNPKMVLYKDGIPDGNNERDDTYFAARYRKKDTRSLKTISLLINGEYNEDNFKNFLDDYTTYYDKKKLFNNFQKQLSIISMETLFDDITRVFIKILDAAANEGNHASAVKSDINSYISELNNTLSSLFGLGHQIYDLQNSGVKCDDLENLKKDFDEQFGYLNKEIYDKIEKYNGVHRIDSLANILSIIPIIKKKDFIVRRDSFMIPSFSNNKILKLLKIIRSF
jgi:hypothetical protein